MDLTVRALLKPFDDAAKASASLRLRFARDPQGKVGVVTNDLGVVRGDEELTVTLRPVRELFTGNAPAPDLARGPTPEVEPFIRFLEQTVATFCRIDGRSETDQEMERIYALLRRRPDSVDGPLHSYIRAAARLYMSLYDISQAQYEAVMAR